MRFDEANDVTAAIGVVRWRRWYANRVWITSSLLATAVIIRVLWCLIRKSGVTGEAFHVASTLAATGQFADAFGPNTGLTAHLPPIGPGIAALVYIVFGIDTITSNFVLAAYAILCVVLSYYLGKRLFAAAGSPITAQWLGLLILAIIPIYLGVETAENRVWETGLTVLVYLGFLNIIVDAELKSAASNKLIGIAILYNAVLFFINPIIGLSSYIIAGIFLMRRFSIFKSLIISSIAAVVLAIVLTPWAVRNYEAMHAFIPLRSNMGLEMALANFPEAVGAEDPGKEFATRFFAIHPSTGQGLQELRLHGGEVAYSNYLKQSTLAWIKSNPIGYFRLSISHFIQFLLPRPWHFTFGFEANLEAEARSATASFIGLLGTICVLYSIIFRSWPFKYIALAVLLPAIGYASFQPSLRYTYLIYCLQSFFCAEVIIFTGFTVLKLRRPKRTAARPHLNQSSGTDITVSKN